MRTSHSFRRLSLACSMEATHEARDSVHRWIVPRKSGTGRWACLLRCGSVETVLSGTEAHTTNNRMELQAVIAGLSTLKEPSAVKVVTDSQYVQRAMTRHLSKWVRGEWVNSRGVPVSNRDLWEALLRASGRHQVTWTWIRGHGASAEQNRCDELAQAAARRLRVAS
jgi:ribonuclease HI